MTKHEFYIQRCIALAKNGLGTTYPNPLVGSVIVYNDRIIGEGWHQKAGAAHAEVNAINSVKDKHLLKKATLYVSLEPCSHFGKTPPCCDLILAHDIPNIVIGTMDPFAKVAGAGIKKLIEKGKNVTVGVLEEACFELNKRFFTFHIKKRPFIILKWAATPSGFIAPLTKEKQEPVWISNSLSRQLVHKWRTEEQAILVGTTTILEDNPKLNARDYYGNNPTRVCLDKSGKISTYYAVKDNSQSTIFITADKKFKNTVNCIYENCIFDENLVENVISILYQHEMQSVIIEGGLRTLTGFIAQDLWDEARIFTGSVDFEKGIAAPKISGKVTETIQLDTDELKIIKNYDGNNYF